MKTITRMAIAALIVAITTLTANAEIPKGYYQSLDGKCGAELKTAVYNIVHDMTLTGDSYSQIYYGLSNTFQRTDLYPQSSKWWDMYSNVPRYAPSFSGLNREHSFPKSWWGGLTDINAYIDLNHLYPADGPANQAKSNYPLGIVDISQSVKYDNGVSLVGYPQRGLGGGASLVFEPADEYKGDFARTYFYMVTAYQYLTWTKKYMWMLRQDTYPTLSDWAINMLLQWAEDDEVSEKEINRNNAVYSIQNNRNPFIDLPHLAEYIWGDKKDQPFDVAANGGGSSTPAGDPTLFTPVQDMALDFGQVAVGQSITAKLLFRGENIPSNLSISIYRGDKQYFSAPTSVPYNLVNTREGYWLTVTYTPGATGMHTSRLLVSDGGLTGSIGVDLRGECLPVPTLNPCTATAATDITSTSYTANWTCPDEVVDYFIVTRTRYTGNEVSESEEIAEGNSLTVDDFEGSDKEAYSVQSVRLGYRSPMSNVIFVDHSSGITGVTVDEPLAIVVLENGIRFICNAPHTGVYIYDITGRLFTTIPEVDNNTDVELPAGPYIITTDNCHKPLRVIVK